MTLWLIVILGLLLLWLVLAPRTGQSATRVREGILGHVPFRRKPASPESIRAMLNDAVRARTEVGGADVQMQLKDLTTWLNGLSKKDLDTFARQLDAAARKSNVNTAWATEVTASSTVLRDLQAVLLFHALGIWRARSLAPLVRLEQYRANPYARSNRQFAQQVFARLAESDATPISPSMMLASEKERSRYVHQVIESAWQANPDQVISIVQEVTGEPTRTQTAPVSETPVETKTVSAVVEGS